MVVSGYFFAWNDAALLVAELLNEDMTRTTDKKPCGEKKYLYKGERVSIEEALESANIKGLTLQNVKYRYKKYKLSPKDDLVIILDEFKPWSRVVTIDNTSVNFPYLAFLAYIVKDPSLTLSKLVIKLNRTIPSIKRDIATLKRIGVDVEWSSPEQQWVISSWGVLNPDALPRLSQ
ncbi:MAG: hypothetical protein CSA26_00580 [Desulfobacterales bacterium]|nr:MAG: hypothetical protein CSA26_00580 [Desulfobacterales bacterium]